MSNRREFSRTVKFEIIRRATVDGKITCEGCGLVLGAKRWSIDHTTPDALEIDKSTPLAADAGKLLGEECCHAPKTADDVRNIARAKRRELRHAGDRKPTRFRKPPDGYTYSWQSRRYVKLNGGQT